MADKRGADYNKRLNYDELKDKITKKKQPIDAPYRTATIVRNSNQMQNLLQMNNLDMQEHQAELEKEQVKQAKVGEIISKEPQVKTPKKQMKNVGVDASIKSVDRFTQAGAKTQETGINATKQTRSTGSDSVETRVIHNSVQTMDESDVQQDQMDDAMSLLSKTSQEQQQSAINQNQSILGKAGNVAQTIAKKGKGVALKAGKGMVQTAVTTGLISQGMNPQFAGLGGSAVGAALDAGYNFTYGGSSSSGMDQSKESKQVFNQLKRDPEDEVEPKGKPGRPRKNRGDEVVLGESGNGNGNKAKAKAKTKAEKREDKEAQQFTQPETDKPSTNIPVKKQNLKQKQDQIAPSVIGIQKVREELLNARNKGKLSNDDYSEYLKLYDSWVSAKGNKTAKKEKLEGLRALYKKSIYRK